MQIIIPMTGYGSRFVNAGYKDLKPFISVLGKPILKWIIDGIYPDEKNIIFVCRGEHLDSIKDMDSLLKDICPYAIIYRIDNWVKKGPVYDVLLASDVIMDNEPVIINYCDFYLSWDWKTFKTQLLARNCDGCVPCYTGFHPNLIPQKNVYASCLTDNNDNLIEIREKYSFCNNKFEAKHSPGVYYFKNGRYLKKYCELLVDSGNSINGEFYASLPYNYMVKDGLNVWVPTNVSYFCQWGTPEDLKEFEYWMDIMKGINI